MLLGLVAVLIVGASFVYWRQLAPTRQAVIIEPPSENQFTGAGSDNPHFEETEPEPQTIVVHVAGEVVKSGVYHLTEGSRVVDAVTAAGGVTAEGDADAINLAQPLIDGQKVWVPKAGEQQEAVPGGPGGDGASGGGKVNINTADLTQLQTLSGIGPSLAQRIIDYRTNNGPFRRLEDIKNVSGIGAKRFEQLKDHITIY